MCGDSYGSSDRSFESRSSVFSSPRRESVGTSAVVKAASRSKRPSKPLPPIDLYQIASLTNVPVVGTFSGFIGEGVSTVKRQVSAGVESIHHGSATAANIGQLLGAVRRLKSFYHTSNLLLGRVNSTVKGGAKKVSERVASMHAAAETLAVTSKISENVAFLNGQIQALEARRREIAKREAAAKKSASSQRIPGC